MGIVASLPLMGASSLASGAAWCCAGQALGALTRSCACQSSVATRVGYSLLFLVNSLLAWTMLTDWATRLVQRYSFDWIKMTCPHGACYGLLAVHRINLGLALLHAALALALLGVKDTRSSKRAQVQNGWWGPKVAAYLALVYLAFLLPNRFFTQFYVPYLALPGSALFILIGLVLLVDFAHSWSETCLEKWEQTDRPLWKWTLIGSTLGLYALTLALVIVQYTFFGGRGCGLNTTLITLNWVTSLALSLLSVAPRVQESNPRSGLAQSGMVVAYTTYLVTSAIANHDDPVPESGSGSRGGRGRCNPLQSRAAGARTGMVVLGAVFTFLAIAYSTSRAATQSRAFDPRGAKSRGGGAGYEALSQEAAVANEGEGEDLEEGSGAASPMGAMPPTTTTTGQPQPRRQDSLRWQAIRAAIDQGSLPPSALADFERDHADADSDAEDGDHSGAHTRSTPAAGVDDERSGTRYNYSFFHVIFVLATMYTACLLTNWSVVSPVNPSSSDGGDPDGGGGQPMRIGRSHVAFWMRIASGWVSQALYGWTLVAPVVWPERFGEL